MVRQRATHLKISNSPGRCSLIPKTRFLQPIRMTTLPASIHQMNRQWSSILKRRSRHGSPIYGRGILDPPPPRGCRPLLFGEWESGSFARFPTNPNYWGEPPKIDEIFVRFVPDDASQTAALVAGDADLGAIIPYKTIRPRKEA